MRGRRVRIEMARNDGSSNPVSHKITVSHRITSSTSAAEKILLMWPNVARDGSRVEVDHRTPRRRPNFSVASQSFRCHSTSMNFNDGKRSIRILMCSVAVLVAGTSVAQPTSAAPKKKKKTPVTKPAKSASAAVAGKPCAKAGERAAGTSLDCVQVGKSLLWEPYGSQLNPIKLNEAAEYTAYEKNRYRLKITGITTLTAADINPGGSGKYPIPSGMVPVKIGAELTYLGPNESNDLPASITDLVAVDATGRKFDTYAGDEKAGGECQQFGDVPSNGTRSLKQNVPLVAGFCVVMTNPAGGVLVNLNWLDDPVGLWWKTQA